MAVSALRLGSALLSCAALASAVGGAFPCPVVAPAKASPADARELHPGHISIVIALGDSLSAAFAAHPELSGLTEPLLPLEYRTLAFSGGRGSEDAWTLPFFLRQYNTSLTGFSSHTTLPQTPATGYLDLQGDGLNLALSNAHSWQLDAEVDALLDQSRAIANFNESWKLLTLLVGANDLCDGLPPDSGGLFAACDGNVTSRLGLAERYEQYLRAVLTRLRDSLPRTLVQLVSLFSLASVPAVRRGHTWCDIAGIGRRLVTECACLDSAVNGQGKPGTEQLEAMDASVAELNGRLHALALEFNLQRPDFAVIEQPTSKGQRIPDASYLSGLDCFHPSSKAHAVTATALWNGLLERHRTPKPLNDTIAPTCPTPETVISVDNGAPTPLVV